MEGNSAGIFISKVSPGMIVQIAYLSSKAVVAVVVVVVVVVVVCCCDFRDKGKMTACCFRRDKTPVLGAIKSQLLNSWNKIPLTTIFYHLNFQLAHPNSSACVSLHKYPFKRLQNDKRKHKKLPFFAFFLFSRVGCPWILSTNLQSYLNNPVQHSKQQKGTHWPIAIV